MWYTIDFSLECDPTLKVPDKWQIATGWKFGACKDLLYTASCIAGCVKRILCQTSFLKEMRLQLLHLRDRILQDCAEIAAKLGISLEQCAKMNVQKIEKRLLSCARTSTSP